MNAGVFALAAALASGASEATNDGNALLNYCNANIQWVDSQGRAKTELTEYQAGYCTGFVRGVTYGFQAGEAMKANRPETFCLPNGVTLSQEIRVLIKFLRDNPARLHEADWALAVEAFAKAFPCQTVPPAKR